MHQDDTDQPLPSPANPKALAATPDVVARLLSEAKTVTTSTQLGAGGPQAVEIQLGHFCNNRCVFCASGQLTERGLAQPVPEVQIETALRAAAATGIRRVTFLGGEPTIQDSFLPSLRLAQQLGFADITVFTNGARFADAGWMAAALQLGRLTWRISIQGGDAASHDLAVARKGAFARILKGLGILQQSGQRVEVNVCLTAGSVAALPQLADVVLQYGVAQLCVDMVRPVSAGERSGRWMRKILPRFQEVVPAVVALLDKLEAADPNYDVSITHLPFCLLPQRADRISHGGDATVTFTADPLDVQGAQDKYTFQASDRTHVPACQACLFRPRCTGVPWQYLAVHGSEELVTVTADVLAERDPLGRAMVDLLRPAVESLVLTPWQATVTADPRQQRWEWHLRHPAGHGAVVVAQALGAGKLPGLIEIAVGPHVRLLAAPEPAADPDLLDALLGQMATALALPSVPSRAVQWRFWQQGSAWLRRLERAMQHVAAESPLAQLGEVKRLNHGCLAVQPPLLPARTVVLQPVGTAQRIAVQVPDLPEDADISAWRAWSKQLGDVLRVFRVWD